MSIFNKIASVKSGNCDVNNFLPIRYNKGRSFTFIRYVQSISHNQIKQGLTFVVNIHTSPGGVLHICITANNQVSSFSQSPAPPTPLGLGVQHHRVEDKPIRE
jgi:hypothetical protein